MRKLLPFLLALFFTPASLFAEEPEPGVQVLQQMELPANQQKRRTPAEREASRAKAEQMLPAERNRFIEDDWKERLGPKPLSKTEKETVSYLLFLPTGYKPKGKKPPLLLFLHGTERDENGAIAAAASGEAATRLKAYGPPKLLDDPDKAKDWPFITVSPLCRDGHVWAPAQLAMLLGALEKDFPYDKNRIYVTGVDSGGFGTWNMLYSFPKQFAAGVPVGGATNMILAQRLHKHSVWAFHGEQDDVVKAAQIEELVKVMREMGGRQIGLTIHPGAGHECWKETYNDPKLYEWLLKQKKK